MSVEEVWDKYFNDGTGGKAVSFLQQGVLFKGVLMEEPTEKQQTQPDGTLKWFDKAETQPRMQLIFKFQTDERDPEDPEDTGVRSLWSKVEQIKAIKESLKEQGLRRMTVGGTLEIAWTHTSPPKVKGWNPTKHFKARWTPPPIGFMADDSNAAENFNFDAAPVATNSAVASPLDALKSMQNGPQRGDDDTPPF
jgi:hypothetical protein